MHIVINKHISLTITTLNKDRAQMQVWSIKKSLPVMVVSFTLWDSSFQLLLNAFNNETQEY